MYVLFDIKDYTVLPISEKGDTPQEFFVAIMTMRKFNNAPKRIRKRHYLKCKKTGEFVVDMEIVGVKDNAKIGNDKEDQ